MRLHPIRSLYSREWRFFKTELVIRFGWLVIFAMILVFWFYVSFLNHPEEQGKIMKAVIEGFQKKGLLGLRDKHSLLAVKIFLTNLQATGIFTVLGFLPFFIGTFLFLFFLSVLLGVALAATITKGLGFLSFIKFTAPHGVFELSAVFYGASLAVYFSREVSKKLLGNRKDSKSFRDLIAQMIRSFCLVIIPLLVLAAVIEAFITPLFK